jgi:hypothetical protein
MNASNINIIQNSLKWLFINKNRKKKLLLMILIIIFLLYFKLFKNSNKIKISKLIDLSEMEKKLNLSMEFIKIYSILLYSALRGQNKKLINSFDNIEQINITKSNKGVGICSIGRKENLYAKEFVEYYLNLGIKKIIIYDDNEINGEKFEDVLKEYIINEKVEIVNIRGFESAQLPSYNNCYMKYRNQFDFLLFLDFDEFVTIENNKDINAYLSDNKFQKCETIVLNWVIYGDNNLVKYDNRTMIERFTKPYGNKNKGKCIVRTNISHLIITYSLKIGINTKYFCDSNGNRIFLKSSNRFKPPKKPEAFIKHFYTKSAEEFCNKINKGDGHFYKNHPHQLTIFNYRIKSFFTYNLITKEKIKIIESCSGINLNLYKKIMKKKEKL